MKILAVVVFVLSVCISLLFGSFYYYLFPFNNRISSASAVIYATKGNQITGSAQFTQEKKGVHVVATIHGLTEGKHGFHIHKYGNCGGDNGTCAGDHFNPTSAPHGAPTDTHVHVGDLGNVVADEHGNAVYDEINYHIALSGPHSIIGRSIIVHQDEDDLHSQPTGNSGNRIGCGVIGISK
ncbi:MAG: superoxide dismutase family protein [Candidatus Dependentiae bacterium]|nr:superoxide dismutase family protein [Candidatus Dependentiae bacterium]